VADVPVISGTAEGFRHRARLAIRGRLGAPKIGMFQLDTHRVVHIPDCIVHHPLINRVADVVRRSLVDAGVSIYSEATHRGLARYLQVVVERRSQSAQVVLVVNSREPGTLATCLDLIRDRLADGLHSLWCNANIDRSNAILGRDFHKWCGTDAVTERFGGPAIHYPPGAFGQNNLEIAERIVQHVREQIPEGARVAEFYAGVGAIGLSVLPKVAAIRMNEVSPQSLQGLAMGLADLDAASRGRVDVVPGPAGETCDAAAGADVVIADPPRKGLDRQLLSHLRECGPQRFIYVSCGLESFIADAVQLLADGRFRLGGLTAFNLMPFTGHVETVACFDRSLSAPFRPD